MSSAAEGARYFTTPGWINCCGVRGGCTCNANCGTRQKGNESRDEGRGSSLGVQSGSRKLRKNFPRAESLDGNCNLRTEHSPLRSDVDGCGQVPVTNPDFTSRISVRGGRGGCLAGFTFMKSPRKKRAIWQKDSMQVCEAAPSRIETGKIDRGQKRCGRAVPEHVVQLRNFGFLLPAVWRQGTV